MTSGGLSATGEAGRPPGPTITGALGFLPAAFLLVQGWTHRWVSEDAFIDFRVVEHLLAGHGPVFNGGERVEAYTNPLWVALLAGSAALGAPLAPAAVLLGLALTVAGVLAAGAATGWPGSDRPARLPLGAVVLAALPPMWDFATSGLESGLSLAWLGITAWLLARRARWAAGPEPPAANPPGRGPFAEAALTGLGPLIRPDLAVFSAAFLGALLVIDRPRPDERAGRPDGPRPGRRGHRLGRWSGLALAALALPVGYQVFRMGYFAGLAPNTALAKEAGLAHWPQGGRYLGDLLATYHLAVPLALLLPWLAARATAGLRRRDRPALALVLLPVAAALLHALYVTRVGGDFMHGRLLLPALFGLLLPVATVSVPAPAQPRLRRLALVAALGVGAWAITCAAALRVPYPGQIGPDGIADERGFYVSLTGRSNPVDPADYADTTWGLAGRALRAQAAAARATGRRLLILPDRTLPLASGVPPAIGVVATAQNIGVQGYLAGTAVHLVDEWGLSDPLASRLRLDRRTRPGHEKSLPEAWVLARFAHPAIPEAVTAGAVAARQALACGDLAALRDAVEGPVTLRRFLTNVALARRLHRLRIASDPVDARATLCGPRAAAGPGGPDAEPAARGLGQRGGLAQGRTIRAPKTIAPTMTPRADRKPVSVPL